MEVEEFQDLGELKPILFEKDSDSYDYEEAAVHPDDSHVAAMEALDEVIREHFSESLAELQGDADRLVITGVEIESDDVPSIEYVTIDE